VFDIALNNYDSMLGKYDQAVHEDYRMHRSTRLSCAMMSVTQNNKLTQIKFKEIYIFGLEK